ncbi:hypothetical protein VPNG_08964 [Cytospora leucostoma]|uniref:Uncharacterized protein n=1 Tax=Cytospora leucostoma TaxID=1230097 RepID=A0A423VW55_9PEZI|nr:hypothetical protein VPNG_08964 [Cytospora leucostoma]
MATPSAAAAAANPSNLTARLRVDKVSHAECLAAIRGQCIPSGLGKRLSQLCVVRGIRYHPGFGLELRGISPTFTRALNARLIMSNHIPEPQMLASEDDVPYCIWHPEVASESTYRELARRFPQMIYQVGRACAVAGYTDLYLDLPILPEVHIAEEARECKNMAIYDHIMAQPKKYNLMNDYERTVRSIEDVGLQEGAFLNGDTAVRRSLELKQEFYAPHVPEDDDDDNGFEYGYHLRYFDITEDMNIDEYEVEDPYANPDDEATLAEYDIVTILSTPLPLDLPTVDKDLLILMAAYYGDIDRYSRLRRPNFVYSEHECIVRGIYHNTLFALWWARQDKSNLTSDIEQAITARMIMNNVLSRVVDTREYDLPYLIWYPSIAAEETYRELFRLRPSMAPQILRACMAGGKGYERLFQEILDTVEPDEAVVKEAKESGIYFRDAMAKRVVELGGEVRRLRGDESYKRCSRRSIERVSNTMPSARGVLSRNSTAGIVSGFDLLYNGHQCASERFDMVACMPKEWWDAPEDVLGLDYVDWPPRLGPK